MIEPGVDVGANLARIRGRLAAAAARVSCRPDEILLVGVTKGVPINLIREAVVCGLTELGENYLQEALPKIEELGHGVRWHFIGSLQRNKVRHVVGRFCLIHSVDSLELGWEIGKRAQTAGLTVPVLVEVNVGSEAAKSGVPVDQALSLVDAFGDVPGILVQGIMGIPPHNLDPEQTRPFFATLKSLFDRLDNNSRRYLSMGMTGDFEQAIEEGSNLVRVGTGIFGARRP
jgi:PLP dependent protein